MDSSPFVVAEGTLLVLAVVLVIEYAFRRREISRQLAQNRQKQQKLATFSAELKTCTRSLPERARSPISSHGSPRS
jgi:heme exporter protein D